MYHFFVDSSQIYENEKKIIIRGNDVNHIRNVLRMKIHEEMLISDGQGHDYLSRIAVFDEEGKDSITAEIVDKTFGGTELKSKIYLFQGLPKSDKMELIIQKATELGVHEIIPIVTKRTVVKLDDKKATAKLKRWNAISKSAAKQSRRGIIPLVKEVMNFQQAVEFAQSFGQNLIPYENFKDMINTKKIIDEIGKSKDGESIGIFIGPEGGFDETEVNYAIENGVHPISLGRRILRTETAGLMIISVLMYKLED